MDTFKSVVLRGNVRNSDERNSPNAAASLLELVPNNASLVHEPVTFYIKFIESNIVIEYSLSVDLGAF